VRPLDRIFGGLSFPWDVLLPSLLWWGLCLAAFLYAWRRLRGARLAAWLATGNAALWGLFFILFAWSASVHELPQPLLLAELPAAAAWQALDKAMWWLLGLAGPGTPSNYFAAAYDWPDGWLPLAAALANQCSTLALLAFPITFFYRAAR
jgi:hypothetical protein